MKTRDDRVFSSLIASSYGLTIMKMPYVMYMLQTAGFELNYRYSIRYGSLKSHGLLNVIGDITSKGYIRQDYSLTNLGYDVLESMFLTNSESELVGDILELCDSCSKDELYLICIVDILIQETKQKGGSSALIECKESIQETAKNLCPCYTDEWFEKAVVVMQAIVEGGRDNA